MTMLTNEAISKADGTKISVIGLMIMVPVLVLALWKAPIVLISGTGIAGPLKSFMNLWRSK